MSRFALRRSSRWAAALAVVLACVLAPGRAEAGPITARISPGSGALAAGGTRDFTVYLDADAGTPATDVAGFTVRLELTGAVGGVQFTGGVMPASGYVFQGNSGGFGAVLGTQNPDGTGGPGLSITLSDFPNDPPFTVGLAGPGTWVLGVVTVAADPNPAGGALQVRFRQDYSGLDGDSAPLGLAFGPDATVQVQGTGVVSPVPVPSALVLIATGAPLLAAWRRRTLRARAAAEATSEPSVVGM